MNTIILPGYSLKNKEWAEYVKKKLEPEHEVVVHEWKHWKTGSFSMKKEIKEILTKIGKKKFNIIAKSVGTSVAMNLIEKSRDSVDMVVLCGIPFKNFSEEKKEMFRKNLPNIPTNKVTIVQNSKDYFGSFEEVKKFIGSINSKIKVVEKERSDHHYPYPTLFKKIIN